MTTTISSATTHEILADVIALRRTVHRYPVTGRTLASWLDVASLVGPKSGNRVYPAYTRWRVRWSYVPGMSPRGVVPTHLTVCAAVDVHLPEWLSRRTATAAESLAWDRWERFLVEHEAAHEQIGRRAAEAILSTLDGASATSTDALDTAVARAAHEEILRHRAMDAALDRGDHP